MTQEIWKDISGYEGLYKISTYGNILSTRRSGSRGGIKIIWISASGYPSTILSKNDVSKTFTIHTLMWDNFSDIPRNGFVLCVDHIDGNKLNNNFSNLQLLTASENIRKSKTKPGRLHSTCLFQGKWQSFFSLNKHRYHVGVFETEIEAHLAAIDAKNKLSLENIIPCQ